MLASVAGSPSISSDGGSDANGSRHTRLRRSGAGSHPSNARQLRGHDQQRKVATFVELPFFARLEILNRRIPMPPQGDVDPLQHDVVDFEALLEGDLAECFIDRIWQVQARVDDGWASRLFPRRASE